MGDMPCEKTMILDDVGTSSTGMASGTYCGAATNGVRRDERCATMLTVGAGVNIHVR